MAESTFFNNLKKLFSQTAIVTVNKDGKRTVADIDHKQQTNLSSLRDRYTKLQTSFHEQAGSIQSMAYQQVRREVFRDFDAMDNDPIIASALDIYADECLAGDTLIPLLDGTKRTIKDLYESGETDIWLYGLNDSDNTFTPVKADKVSYNGKKQLYEITFDDGTQIKCTSNHIWIDSNGKQIFTDDLTIGQSILALPTKISDNKYMNGYEMIWNGKSYEYIHRVVGNTVQHLVEQKAGLETNQTKILHHTSFDKRNNNPYELEWMGWGVHNKIHADFNKQLWNDINSDPERKSDYYDKLITGQQRFWNSEDSTNHRIAQSERMTLRMNRMSADERKSIYGSVGSDNGMYDNGYKLTGGKNGRYDKTSTRMSDIDVGFVKSEIQKNPKVDILNTLRVKLNVNKFEWHKFIKLLLDQYNVTSSKTLINKILAENSTLLSKFRKYSKEMYNPTQRFTLSDFCISNGIDKCTLQRTVAAAGYGGTTEFASSSNHKVISIEKIGIEDTYDMVNAGDNHIYALESNDGSKLYTHNSTLKNEFGDVMTIRSDNEEVQELLENLFYDILNVEFNLWPWVRNMCKYGDFFLGLEMAEGKGILNVTPHSVYNTERIESSDPRTPSAVRFKVEMDPNIKNEYDNYEMAHFRLLSDTNWLPYGKAMIENGRRLWKQLSLMEDAMLIHRIMRAPEKRVFKVDIGNIKPTEVDNYMQKIINKMKKVPFLDKSSGDYNLKYNMQNLTEDFYLPVRGSDSGTSIDTVGGLEYTAIEDIDYLKDKLFAALKIPRAYLGYEENVCVVPETEIPLLNGEIKTVAELITDYEDGVTNYVYSIDEMNNIVPGQIEWAGMTRKNAKLVRVHLDNEKYIDCTPDHNFMTRDGIWVEAQDLKEGQSLMPLYLSQGGYKNSYTTVYNPATSKYELVHNIVADNYGIKQSNNVIHHSDFNKLNNNPENLDGSMTFWEHRDYHSKLTEYTLNSPENIKNRISDSNWLKSTKIAGKIGGLKSGNKLGEWVKQNGPFNKGIYSGKTVKCPTCGNDFYKHPNSTKIYCSKKCNTNERYNVKYTKITIDELINVASTSKSFLDIAKKLNIDRNTLNRIFDYNNINRVDFITNYMSLAVENKGFINNFKI